MFAHKQPIVVFLQSHLTFQDQQNILLPNVFFLLITTLYCEVSVFTIFFFYLITAHNAFAKTGERAEQYKKDVALLQSALNPTALYPRQKQKYLSDNYYIQPVQFL
ncbi:Hypothetical_protein [Hexamita inflata]|uniref:Hypothetical_protein n=1 Tax=Hexamita inflata TaxID=28002 RepID=A0ABP1HEP5_9EUKA